MTAARFVWGPGSLYGDGAIGGQTSLLFNSANVGAAVRFTAPRAGTITAIEFHVTIKTGADRDIQGRVVGLTAGIPNTTLHGGSAAGTLTISSAGHKTIPLGTPATVTAGQQIAARLDPTGTAPDGSNQYTIELGLAGFSGDDHMAWPQVCDTANGGATWTRRDGAPMLGLLMGDGTYIFADLGDSPTQALAPTLTAYNSGSSPNEYGARFQVPYSMSCIGIRMTHQCAVAGTRSIAKLYDSDGNTVLGTGTHYNITAARARRGYWHWPAVALSANQNYYLGLTNSSAANNQTEPYYLTVQNVASKGAWPMLDGSRWSYASRTGAGAWTVNTLRVPIMAVVCDGVG